MNKEILNKLKEQKQLVAIAGFCLVTVVMIILSIALLKENVVPVCIMMILEAAIAVMLHKAELWVHGVLLVAELIAGVVAGNIPLIILCGIVYVAATVALQIVNLEEK